MRFIFIFPILLKPSSRDSNRIKEQRYYVRISDISKNLLIKQANKKPHFMALKLPLRLKNQEISQGMFTVLKIYLLILLF